MVVAEELVGHRHRALNTFEKWYKLQSTDLDMDDERAAAPSSPAARFTWSGTLFGRPSRASTDIIADQNSASALRQTRRISSAQLGFSTDHFALFATYKFKDIGIRTFRRSHMTKKPMHWAPDDPEQYNLKACEMFQHAGRMTITTISDKLGDLARSEGRPRPRPVPWKTSSWRPCAAPRLPMRRRPKPSRTCGLRGTGSPQKR